MQAAVQICSIDRSHTYAGCSTKISHTYMSCSIDRSRTYGFLLVQEVYKYRLITGLWQRLVTVYWHKLVQVYNGISHNDSVAVVSSFHLYFKATGRGKDRWFWPPSGCSRNIWGCILDLLVARELGSWSFHHIVA